MQILVINVTVVIQHTALLTAVSALLLAMFICVCLSVFVCLSSLFITELRNYELYVYHHRLSALMDISIW